MLERNPDFARSAITFAKQNLNELSAEMMGNYLHTIALPELLRQRQDELDDTDFVITDLLRENRLTKLTLLPPSVVGLIVLGLNVKPGRKAAMSTTMKSQKLLRIAAISSNAI
jgi:hypothetical protein